MKKVYFSSILIVIFFQGCFSTSGEKAKKNDTLTFQGLEYKVIESSQTGRLWLDRNLGATKKCDSLTDKECYGSLYSWGVPANGHESRGVENTKKKNFSWYRNYPTLIKKQSFVNDIQGDKICPKSFRMSTNSELKSEFQRIDFRKVALKEKDKSKFGLLLNTKYIERNQYEKNHIYLPLAGYAEGKENIYSEGREGKYWTSQRNQKPLAIKFSKYISPTQHLSEYYDDEYRFSIRCIKEVDEKLFFNTDKIEYKMAYYYTGVLKIALPVKKGTKIKHGIAKSYDKNGLLESSINFKDGKQNGSSISYNKQGSKKVEVVYLNGIPHGKATEYNFDSSIKEQRLIKNGKESKILVKNNIKQQ